MSQEVEQLDQSQKKLLDPFIATAKEAMLLNRVNNVKKCIYGLCTGKIRSKDAQDVLANYYTLSTENDKKIAELTKTISLPMNKILLEQLAKPIDFDMDLLKTLTICKDLLKIYDQDKKLTSLDTDNKTLLASLPEAIEFFTLKQITEYFKQNGISSTTELNHINESQKDAILTGLFESNKFNNFIEAYLRLNDKKFNKSSIKQYIENSFIRLSGSETTVSEQKVDTFLEKVLQTINKKNIDQTIRLRVEGCDIGNTEINFDSLVNLLGKNVLKMMLSNEISKNLQELQANPR